MAAKIIITRNGKTYTGSSAKEVRNKMKQDEKRVSTKEDRVVVKNAPKTTQPQQSTQEELLYTPAEPLLYTPAPPPPPAPLLTASDLVSSEYTPDYSQMQKSRKYVRNNNVVGIEDVGTGMSYATQETDVKEFEDLEKQRYKEALTEALKQSGEERNRQLVRARDLRKAYIETGGRLSGKELQEYYGFYPQEQPTLSLGEKAPNTFQRGLRAAAAGERDSGVFVNLLGAKFGVGMTDKGAYSLPNSIYFKEFGTKEAGASQFDTNWEKGIYETTKLGGLAAEYYTLFGNPYNYYKGMSNIGKGLEVSKSDRLGAGILGNLDFLKKSKTAFETAKVGGTYKLFDTAARVGKSGKFLNLAAKGGTALGVTLVGGKIAYEGGKALTLTKRTLGLDLKKKDADFVKEEQAIARKGGLVAASLYANVVSQAAGSQYVVRDTGNAFLQGRTLTAMERFKNVATAGFGEGAGITYFAQEAFEDNRPFAQRAAEIGFWGAGGALTAGIIDLGINAPQYAPKKLKGVAKVASAGLEGFAYGTDLYEGAGDYVEMSLRGGRAFEEIKPVRINTQADSIFNRFNGFGAKTKTDTKTKPVQPQIVEFGGGLEPSKDASVNIDLFSKNQLRVLNRDYYDFLKPKFKGKFINADYNKELPLKKGTFDKVTSSYSLDVFGNRKGYQNAFDLLKEGGKISLTTGSEEVRYLKKTLTNFGFSNIEINRLPEKVTRISGIKPKTTLALKQTQEISPLKQDTRVALRLNELTNTKTAVTLRGNTRVPVITNTNLQVISDVKPIVDTNTNTLVDIKENINENIRENINENINEQVNVFVPTAKIPPMLFLGGGGAGTGFAKGGRIALSKYKPSLLGIARGKKATKTSGLSGFEVRGLENVPSVEKTAKSFKFGGFSVKPQKSGIGMKFKVSKTKPSGTFGKVGGYFKKLGSRSIL